MVTHWANASLIVESVNQHAALLEVVEAARKYTDPQWNEVNRFALGKQLVKALAKLDAIRKV